MQEYALTVGHQESGKRLDVFLIDYFRNTGSGLSRTALQELISTGNVKVEGEVVRKPHHKVKFGQWVNVTVEEKKEVSPQSEDIALDVIYEDGHLAVINKQAGLVVHPAPGNYEHTLVNALLHRFKSLSDINPGRPGIVHRLDKDTSGLLVIAKDNATHLNLAKQFSEHSIERKYIAIVKGKMEFEENVIDAPIARHKFRRKQMSVSFLEGSRYAKTYYRTIKRTKGYSLVELRPLTGRTHQLRVHLAFIGHPILGDNKYAKNNDSTRLFLHAQEIGFVHPDSGQFLSFKSSMPKEFVDFLEKNEKR